MTLRILCAATLDLVMVAAHLLDRRLESLGSVREKEDLLLYIEAAAHQRAQEIADDGGVLALEGNADTLRGGPC